jgi:2-polyprenyl-3-methyl-5-hydroxy-6-metoxy-1,4-benzoquinol methylase
MTATTSKSNYVLGYDEAEYVRLEMQAKALEPFARQALTAAGVSAGWRCLDVACGTGAVTRVLGEMVGASGSVHAVDIDVRHADVTVAQLRESGPDIYSTEQFDATGSGSPRGAPFNLVFARLLICHMTDPAGTLKNLWSWVAPGGVLLIQDYDMGVVTTSPPNALGEEGTDVLHQCFARAGKDYRAGSSMPHYFLRAGIGPHDAMLYGCTSVPGARGRQGLVAVLTSLKVPAVKLGLKTEAEYDAFLSALASDAPPADSVTRMPDLISVWKKREG